MTSANVVGTPPSTVLTLVSPTLWSRAGRAGTGRGIALGVGGCPGNREALLCCGPKDSVASLECPGSPRPSGLGGRQWEKATDHIHPSTAAVACSPRLPLGRLGPTKLRRWTPAFLGAGTAIEGMGGREGG